MKHLSSILGGIFIATNLLFSGCSSKPYEVKEKAIVQNEVVGRTLDKKTLDVKLKQNGNEITVEIRNDETYDKNMYDGISEEEFVIMSPKEVNFEEPKVFVKEGESVREVKPRSRMQTSEIKFGRRYQFPHELMFRDFAGYRKLGDEHIITRYWLGLAEKNASSVRVEFTANQTPEYYFLTIEACGVKGSKIFPLIYHLGFGSPEKKK